ncbi:MAG: hypothetical protein LCH82_02370 [Actinobacteria bacterium]|nr:hypothetical protein [Actinomycetota bacterium]
MKVHQIIALLEELDANAEVRMATQPSWPLANEVRGIATNDDIAGAEPCETHGDYSCDDCAGEPVVWIVAGDSPDDSPYAPGAAFAMAVSL